MEENNNKNNKGLIIIVVVIFIACAILTSMMVKFGKVIGKMITEKIHDSAGVQTINIFDHIDGDLIFDKTYDLDGKENLNIRTVAANVIIKENNENNIKVAIYGKEGLEINANEDEKNLLIDFKDQDENHVFAIGINDFTNKMVIYLPRNYANSINIDTKYGNIDIGLDLNNTSLEIDSEYGNIDMKYIKNAKVECEFGNIQIEKVLNKIDLKTNYGNIMIEELDINEDSNIVTEYGNIEITKTSDIRIDTDVKFGEAKVKNSKQDADVTLNIASQMGFIEVN